VSPYGTSSAMG